VNITSAHCLLIEIQTKDLTHGQMQSAICTIARWKTLSEALGTEDERNEAETYAGYVRDVLACRAEGAAKKKKSRA
jgi:hypothetical protein